MPCYLLCNFNDTHLNEDLSLFAQNAPSGITVEVRTTPVPSSFRQTRECEPMETQDGECEEPMETQDGECEEPMETQDGECEEPMETQDGECEEPMETQDGECEEPIVID